MRYKKIGHDVSHRLSIPALAGGVNTSTDAALIEDDQLAAVKNLCWHDGALKARDALCAKGVAPFYAASGSQSYAMTAEWECVCAHPFTVKGVLCTVVVSMAAFGTAAGRVLHVITLDGEVIASYTVPGMGSTSSLYPLCVVPCDRTSIGHDFLVYCENKVLLPDDETALLTEMPSETLYAPLVMVSGRSYATGETTLSALQATANGVMYEGFNALTPRYRARYTGGHNEGTLEVFCLPQELDGTPHSVRVRGVTPYGTFDTAVPTDGETATFTLHNGEGVINYTVRLESASSRVYIKPTLPQSTVSDNIEITVTPRGTSQRGTAGATIAAWFGGTNDRLGGTRLFLAGFEDERAKVMWSDVNNPLYFPENNYMLVGDPSQAVTALEKQDDMLVVFKEREMYYTTYVQGSIDAEAVIEGTNVDVTVSGAYFPLKQLAPYLGCDCPRTIAICRNRLVWMNADARVYTLASANSYSEANVREIGQAVYPLIRAQLDTLPVTAARAASAMDHKGRYHLQIGRYAYGFDYSDSGFVNLNAYASGKTAARNIAWSVYEYTEAIDSAATNAEWNVVISDGDRRAILINTRHIGATVSGDTRTQYAFMRVLYAFCEQECDEYMTMTDYTWDGYVSGVRDHAIAVSLTTKTFTLGDAALYKRLEGLWLIFRGAATLTTIADGVATDPVPIRATERGIRRVFPGVKRCSTVAFRIDSESATEVQGLRLQYASFGSVV